MESFVRKSVLFASVLLLSCTFSESAKLSWTSNDFLIAVRNIIDFEVLNNSQQVSDRLRIAIQSTELQPVFDQESNLLAGYSSEGQLIDGGQLIQRKNFNYGFFYTEKRKFSRALISLPIDDMMLCISEDDFKAVFPSAKKYINPHIIDPQYTYKPNGTLSVDSTFSFKVDSRCLYRLSIFQDKEDVRKWH